MNEDKQSVWKVTHAKDDVETVLLVTAFGERDARRQAMDHLYPNDDGNNWTVMYWMKARRLFVPTRRTGCTRSTARRAR